MQRNVLTIVGLRYSQAKELILNLRKDKTFQKIDFETKQYVIERILDEIKGRMLEDIIHSDHSEIFEIKHSERKDAQQAKNLLDEKRCSLFETRSLK